MQIYLTDNLLFIHEQIIMIALYSCNLCQIERKKELQKMHLCLYLYLPSELTYTSVAFFFIWI